MPRAKPWGAARSAAGRSPCTLGDLVLPPLGAWCCSFAASAALPAVGYLAAGQPVLPEGGADAKRWGNPAGVPFTRRPFFFLIFLNTFLVFAIFSQKRPESRMDARFCLWITLHLFGQITGFIRTNYGLVGQITGAIHRPIRTNYGRYPQI